MTRATARLAHGHLHGGPNKIVLHACAQRGRPDPPSFRGVTDRAVVTKLHPEVQRGKSKASPTRRPAGGIRSPHLALEG